MCSVPRHEHDCLTDQNVNDRINNNNNLSTFIVIIGIQPKKARQYFHHRKLTQARTKTHKVIQGHWILKKCNKR